MTKSKEDILDELINSTHSEEITWACFEGGSEFLCIDGKGECIFRIFKHVDDRGYIHLDYHEQTGLVFAYGHDDLYDQASELYELVKLKNSFLTANKQEKIQKRFEERQCVSRFEKYKQENNKPDLTLDEYYTLMREKIEKFKEELKKNKDGINFGSWSD